MAVPFKKRTKVATPRRANEVLRVEFDREEDGRWIAEVPALPGVMVYGRTRKDALIRVQALALRVLAGRIEREKTTRSLVKFA